MGAFNDFLGTASGGLVTGTASGLFNFGLGQIGAAIQHKRNKELMDKSQEQQLEQMAQSQEYNLANMEVQNQYQIDAENRANEWNSAKAQVQRAREAGVSPLAALGSGGAGGSMGVSSAPSSSTPQGSGSSPATGSGTSATFNLAQAMQAGAQIGLMASEKAEADARERNLNEQTRGLEFDNAWKSLDMEFIPEEREIKNAEVAYRKLYNNLRKAYVSGGMGSEQWKIWQEELRYKYNSADKEEANAEYLLGMYEYYQELKKDTAATRNARINQLNAAAYNGYKQAALAIKAAETEEERAKLVSADTEVAKQRKLQIEKEIDRLAKINDLTDQQIRQIKNNISLAWAKFGVNTAISVSREARGWFMPWFSVAEPIPDSSDVSLSGTMFDGTGTYFDPY